MTNDSPSNDKPDFTLKGEIKKRRRQEIQRVLEQKKIDATRGLSPASKDTSRASQTMPVAPAAEKPQSVAQTNASALPSH